MIDGDGVVPVHARAHVKAVALAQRGASKGADLTGVEVVTEQVVQVLSNATLAGPVSTQLERKIISGSLRNDVTIILGLVNSLSRILTLVYTYSARRLIGSLWAESKVITLTD